jgi:hypothetical protein
MSNRGTVYCVVRSCAGAGAVPKNVSWFIKGRWISCVGALYCAGTGVAAVASCHAEFPMCLRVSVFPVNSS